MGIMITNAESFDALNSIQMTLQPTEMIKSGVYMCDCTGCSSGCYEYCADGNGPSD